MDSLFEQFCKNPSIVDKLLILACRNENHTFRPIIEEMIDYCINNHIKLNSSDKKGNMAIHYLCLNQSQYILIDVISKIISYDKSIAQIMNSGGDNIIDLLYKNQTKYTVQILLKIAEQGINLDRITNKAKKFHSYHSIIINVNAYTKYTSEILYLILSMNNIEMDKSIISYIPLIVIYNEKYNKNSYREIINPYYSEILHVCIKFGANVNTFHRDPMLIPGKILDIFQNFQFDDLNAFESLLIRGAKLTFVPVIDDYSIIRTMHQNYNEFNFHTVIILLKKIQLLILYNGYNRIAVFSDVLNSMKNTFPQYDIYDLTITYCGEKITVFNDKNNDINQHSYIHNHAIKRQDLHIELMKEIDDTINMIQSGTTCDKINPINLSIKYFWDKMMDVSKCKYSEYLSYQTAYNNLIKRPKSIEECKQYLVTCTNIDKNELIYIQSSILHSPDTIRPKLAGINFDITKGMNKNDIFEKYKWMMNYLGINSPNELVEKIDKFSNYNF